VKPKLLVINVDMKIIGLMGFTIERYNKGWYIDYG
jgi:hypothetical protein